MSTNVEVASALFQQRMTIEERKLSLLESINERLVVIDSRLQDIRNATDAQTKIAISRPFGKGISHQCFKCGMTFYCDAGVCLSSEHRCPMCGPCEPVTE